MAVRPVLVTFCRHKVECSRWCTAKTVILAVAAAILTLAVHVSSMLTAKAKHNHLAREDLHLNSLDASQALGKANIQLPAAQLVMACSTDTWHGVTRGQRPDMLQHEGFNSSAAIILAFWH